MLTGALPTVDQLDPIGLFAPVRFEPRLGLAVSGGPDSLALMVLASRWRSLSPDAPVLNVYVFDHRLRSGSAEEAAMVAQAAHGLGLKVTRLAWEAPHTGAGLQAAARAARYRAIGEAMARDGVGVLATGHHSADQAETVLMRLAHGSGISGLAGMRPFSQVEGVRVFRPLLDIDPADLAAVVGEAGLEPALDPSNGNPEFERVRWRALCGTFDEIGLTAARIGVFARRAGRLDALARQDAEAFWLTHCAVNPLGVVAGSFADLNNAPEEIGIRVLSMAIEVATGKPVRALAALENLHEALVARQTGTAMTLAGACIMVRNTTLLVFRESGRMASERIALVPGAPIVWDNRFRVCARQAGYTIGPATDVVRPQAADLLGPLAESMPMAAIAAAPAVFDCAGRCVSIGAPGDPDVAQVAPRA
ncbi:tRNA lysidine(34) synthetase TilS [Pelagibacterium montanilacus]|uniref:tRNA lysidine(34) synthetase TilS n=1 Tax=Pelagibacterium montanilacus TaxID=2185280 RepID=UPI0013E0A810|nr:tRNA lysidine(34) synthetase TilS [Pelagibacterium montanilacus]